MSSLLIEQYRSSPSWLKALVILIFIYVIHRIWAQFMRTRRELQAASWILHERRKAGIPDSDKRPFKIAKAAVEANRKKSSHSSTPLSASTQPPPLTHQPSSLQPSSSLRSQPNVSPPSPELSNSVETIRSARDNQDEISVISHASNQSQVSSNTRHRSNKLHPLNTTPSPENSSRKSDHPKPSSSPKPLHIVSHPPLATTNQQLVGRSLQKRVAPLSTDGSDPDLPEIQEENLTTRNRKKAKTQKNPSSSQLNSELAIPGKFADNQSARKLNSDGSPKKFQLRKKRILSDCVGEADNAQATRIKKGRSENQTEQANPLPVAQDTHLDAQVSMQVEETVQREEGRAEHEQEEDEEEEEEEDVNEPNEEKKDSDTERYMTGNDGRIKKLVQIRHNSLESNYSPEEGAEEYRWVTRRQFRDLGQRGMLLEDEQWEGDSVTSLDSLDSSRNHLSTPSKRTSSITIERGPIWSIEGKKSISKSPLPASEISPKPPSVSRPRNSLGRIRLSLPPDPASPLQRSRSRLLSPLRPSID